MSGKCGNCKWWGKHSHFQSKHRACFNDKLDERNEGDDDLGYSYEEGGVISTGKDFGCIYFEEKSVEQV